MLARDCPCADCGVVMGQVACVSFYFARPLCAICFRLETLRSTKDAELFVLEHMYRPAMTPHLRMAKATVHTDGPA